MLGNLASPVKSKTKRTNRLAILYEKFLSKSVDEYNSQDLVFYFKERYEEKLGEPYRFSFVKETAQMKRLLDTYGIYGVVNLIEYAIRYKRPISIGMLASGWSNTWYMEMISTYGTSRNTLKYRCLLLCPQLSPSMKDKIVWMINQVEETKSIKDLQRFNRTIENLDRIYNETSCTPFLTGEYTG